MLDEKTKMLALMRFWLFGTFLIVWAAITMFIGLFTDRDWLLAITTGFPIWGLVGALCIIWYFVYKVWLDRNAKSESPGSDS
jgi:hypothetical protein